MNVFQYPVMMYDKSGKASTHSKDVKKPYLIFLDLFWKPL